MPHCVTSSDGTYAALGALLALVGGTLLVVRRIDPLDTPADAGVESPDIPQRAAP